MTRSFKRWRAALTAATVATAVVAVTTGHADAVRAVPAPVQPMHCTVAGHKQITVVLVHGAWADNSSWSGETKRLLRDGCRVRAADVAVKDLASDASAVANYVRTIHGPVLLVGHSYGGAVISNAATEVHNVVGLVYIDAYAPAVGEAISNLSGSKSALATHPADQVFKQIPGAPSGQQNLILRRSAFVHYFANDLPRAKARALWASETVASTGALMAPSASAAWKTLPSWSFISTGDQIITPPSLRAMAHRAHSHITVFHGGSHITLVSHPAAVVSVIGKALRSLYAKE